MNLGLVYADNHPVMQGKKFGCPDRKTLRDPSLGIVEASTFNTHSGSFMVSIFNLISKFQTKQEVINKLIR